MSHYFMNDDNVKSKRRIVKFDILGESFKVITDNGVFAKDGFDLGSRMLLESVVISDKNFRVLDLGCGYGVVGIVLKKLFANIRVDMVDVNERAVKLALENILLNKVEAKVFISDVYAKVEGSYDYIITNPPIRAGKEILRRFLIGSYDYLCDNGELWFVMRKDHGVKSMIKELEERFSCEVVRKSKGFYVVRAIKRK